METLVERAPKPVDERTLVERCRAGDDAAFDAIVAEHRVAIYGVARRILGTHEDADEAAQRTFVRAWRALERFRGESALRTWLTRIAVNVARSMLSARRPVERLDDGLTLPAPDEGADGAVERRENRVRVRRAVAGLPPRQREVVVLKVFGEMTYRDVAAVLELSEGAVKAHLHQAVRNLRKALMTAAGSEAT